MRSVAQNRTTLGTDDQDAIRWLYGDGLDLLRRTCRRRRSRRSRPRSGSPAGGTSFTVTGTNFVAGATVSIGGTAATVTKVTATSITGKTRQHATGTADVVVTNPDTKKATLAGGYFYDFVDVPTSYLFHNAVVKIFKDGITTGCGGNNYCPGVAVNRDQMSVFVLRGMHGSAYTPPAATGTVFDGRAARHDVRRRGWRSSTPTGIIDACGASPLTYCPSNNVSRAEMAVLLLRGKHGASYTPPPAAGIFADVPSDDPLAPWIEQLSAEGITSGCGAGNYCPSLSNTRGEMAAFLARTFNLP